MYISERKAWSNHRIWWLQSYIPNALRHFGAILPLLILRGHFHLVTRHIQMETGPYARVPHLPGSIAAYKRSKDWQNLFIRRVHRIGLYFLAQSYRLEALFGFLAAVYRWTGRILWGSWFSWRGENSAGGSLAEVLCVWKRRPVEEVWWWAYFRFQNQI